MAQDFLGSIAQEDVQFVTQILSTTTPGENFWRLMAFIEDSRFVEDQTAFIQKPGTTLKVASVTIDNYMSVTKGLLRSWLDDFFVSTLTGATAILVQCGVDIADPASSSDPIDPSAFISAMEEAYDQLKDYAYWKTACAGTDDALDPEIAVALAKKCLADKDVLSAAPLYPITTTTPETLSSDPIYAALMADATADAILTAHQDGARNGSLFRLGQAIAFRNESGTAVGNNMDYISSEYITPSGEIGTNLSKAVRDALKTANVGFFKPVGDTTGNAAAVGVRTLRGFNIQALWIVAYINFMAKVMTARYITQPNRLRNASTYADILDILRRYLNFFSNQGSGRLQNVVVSAPAFSNLPPAKGDEIIIPNAWSADYTDQVHTVKVFGSLTIAASV